MQKMIVRVSEGECKIMMSALLDASEITVTNRDKVRILWCFGILEKAYAKRMEKINGKKSDNDNNWNVLGDSNLDASGND